jgi:hypothetical protein
MGASCALRREEGFAVWLAALCRRCQHRMRWNACTQRLAEERERRLEQFEQKGFAVWLAALRRFMERGQ